MTERKPMGESTAQTDQTRAGDTDTDSDNAEQRESSEPEPWTERSTESAVGTVSRLTSTQRSSSAGAGTPSGGTGGVRVERPSPGPGSLSERYDMDVGRREAGKLQRLEDDFGVQRVSEWSDEGMPVETMGKPRDMQAFRQRQAERSEEIPADIERRNQASVQRNTARNHDDGPAGDTGVPDSVRSVIRSPGQSLDSVVQREMEDRMGEDFSDVQVHTGPAAANAAEDINARAFTVGNHVAFNQGEYDPDSAEGQRVIAHELAHVRQQTGGDLSMLPKEEVQMEVDPDPKLEQEAKETAQRVMRGGELGIQRSREDDIHVQRKDWNHGPSVAEQVGYDDDEEYPYSYNMEVDKIHEFAEYVIEATKETAVTGGILYVGAKLPPGMGKQISEDLYKNFKIAGGGNPAKGLEMFLEYIKMSAEDAWEEYRAQSGDSEEEVLSKEEFFEVYDRVPTIDEESSETPDETEERSEDASTTDEEEMLEY